tara:strand:- start:12705 stop:13271 length:567 start_codon:yes stop_codon:yes gene_type:complete
MSFTDTLDTPTRLAIEPDWLEGIDLQQMFSSAVTTAYGGPEQRQAKREKPIYRMSYSRGGLTADQARRRLQAIRSEFRQPLIVPLWPDGITLQALMTVDTAALLDVSPIEGEFETPLDLYFWDRTLGGEWRTCTVITGRTLTLSGSGTLYPAGSYVFPGHVMIKEPEEGNLESVDLETGIERLTFKTL